MLKIVKNFDINIYFLAVAECKYSHEILKGKNVTSSVLNSFAPTAQFALGHLFSNNS